MVSWSNTSTAVAPWVTSISNVIRFLGFGIRWIFGDAKGNSWTCFLIKFSSPVNGVFLLGLEASRLSYLPFELDNSVTHEYFHAFVLEHPLYPPAFAFSWCTLSQSTSCQSLLLSLSWLENPFGAAIIWRIDYVQSLIRLKANWRPFFSFLISCHMSKRTLILVWIPVIPNLQVLVWRYDKCHQWLTARFRRRESKMVVLLLVLIKHIDPRAPNMASKSR